MAWRWWKPCPSSKSVDQRPLPIRGEDLAREFDLVVGDNYALSHSNAGMVKITKIYTSTRVNCMAFVVGQLWYQNRNHCVIMSVGVCAHGCVVSPHEWECHGCWSVASCSLYSLFDFSWPSQLHSPSSLQTTRGSRQKYTIKSQREILSGGTCICSPFLYYGRQCRLPQTPLVQQWTQPIHHRVAESYYQFGSVYPLA